MYFLFNKPQNTKKLGVKDNFDQKKYIFSYNFRYLSSFLQVFIFISTKMKKKLKDYLCHHDRYCIFKSASISCFLRWSTTTHLSLRLALTILFIISFTFLNS